MKKKLCKTMGNQKNTVEAYNTCNCNCDVDCNPCSNYPSDAYITQRDNRHSSLGWTAVTKLTVYN